MHHSNIEPRQFFSSYDHVERGHDPAPRRNPYPGVVILIEEADRVLLVQRGEGHFQAGRWCLPGGFIEYEENFLSAGLREVKEETGLAVRVESILSVVSNFLAPRLHTLVVVLLAHPVASGDHARAGDDADSVAWYPLSGPLPGMAFEADVHIIQRYEATRLPGLPVDPRFAIEGKE